jgi:hypothetical protein
VAAISGAPILPDDPAGAYPFSGELFTPNPCRSPDIVMDFEGSYGTLTASPPPAWVYRYPAAGSPPFSSCPTASRPTSPRRFSLTRADNAGHVYVADQPNYSALPVCWSREDADVTAECAA